MNDTTFVEAARHLAAQAIKQSGPTSDSPLSLIFRMVLNRNPNPQEQTILERSYERVLADFKHDPESARALLQVGESAAAKDLNATQLAALTTLASTLLCMDEAVTRP